MRANLQVIERQLFTVWTIIIATVLSVTFVTDLRAQTNSGFQMKTSGDSSDVSATSADGVPERGTFQFIYSYSGEPIEPDINISVNGSQIVELSSLAPVTNDTLVNRMVAKEDNIDMYASFGIAEATIFLHTGLVGYSPGFWAGWGSITFYEYDPVDGSIIQVYGTMNYEYYHRPPWNGIEVTAEPEKLMAGEASDITLQPYEVPGEPVILPDVTYINLQTSFLGDLIGGLGLPEYGYRYVKGFNNAPWSLLKDTEILYEVHPSIETSDPLGIPIVAYSPYDLSKSGSTVVEVGEEDDLKITVTTENDEVYPQQTGGSTQTAVTVKVTKNGEPESGVPVSFNVNPAPNSGGHYLHGDNRPTGTVASASGVTDGNGSFTTTYTSSQIAGTEWISVSSSRTNDTDSTDVDIKVTNLTEFNGNGSYILRGASDEHPKNHFIYEEAEDDLITAINDFVRASWHQTGDMKLNDMSLKWGGLFDLNNEWTSSWGHVSHRTGRDVDIENLVVKDTTVTVTHPVTGEERERTVLIANQDWLEQYKLLMEEKNWRFIDEGQTNPERDPEDDDPTLRFPHFRWVGG